MHLHSQTTWILIFPLSFFKWWSQSSHISRLSYMRRLWGLRAGSKECKKVRPSWTTSKTHFVFPRSRAHSYVQHFSLYFLEYPPPESYSDSAPAFLSLLSRLSDEAYAKQFKIDDPYGWFFVRFSRRLDFDRSALKPRREKGVRLLQQAIIFRNFCRKTSSASSSILLRYMCSRLSHLLRFHILFISRSRYIQFSEERIKTYSHCLNFTRMRIKMT